VSHSERTLLGPGPSNPYPEVQEAAARPLLGHLDPEFLQVLDSVTEGLRAVFGTSNTLTFPVSGTGSAGMEAAFVNVTAPEDVVVVGVNGLFGERMCDVAGRCGATVVRVEAPWGTPLDPEAVLRAHPAPSVIAVVHAETSTGVRNDVAAIAAGKGDALLLADCVTSLGGTPVALDAWGVDLAYSATQKCLGVPPGLAPFSASERAEAALLARPRSWYLDLQQIRRYVVGEGARAYHHTAPTAMIVMLDAALRRIREEGLDEVWRRHEECGRSLQDGLEAMGLTLFAQQGHRLPQLTSVWVPEARLPDGLDEAAVRRLLLDRFGVEIGGGVGPFAGRVWRIGCMGHAARPRTVALLLAALEEVLT